MKVSHKSAFALVVSLCFSFRIAYGDLAPATGSLPRFIDMGTSSILLRYRPDGTLAQRRHTRRYTELFTDRKGVTRERVRTDETRHTFAGSFESVSGRGWIYHFDGGYVTMTDGEAHYFARDYQGSTRAVYTASTSQIAPLAAVADAGATPQPQYTLEQATAYYPTGLPVDITAEATAAPASSAATDRLHIGNRWINHAGLGYYDNIARYFDALTVRFTAPDLLDWKTQHLSPWSHCAGNPANLIDPSGMESIYVFRNKQLEKVGETNPNDPNNYIVKNNKRSINKVLKRVASGEELTNTDYLAILPDGDAFNEILHSLDEAQSAQVEQGGHVDYKGDIIRWEPGPGVNEGERENPITPFNVEGGRTAIFPFAAKLYWHVHPKIDFSNGNALGGSSPSEEDKKFDNKMREANYKGTTLLVGGRKEEVTFYYKNKVIAKIPIIILNPLYEK